MCGSIPRLPAVPPPTDTDSDLLNVIPMGDPHFGLLSWKPETGEDFNLEQAEAITFGAVDKLVARAPKAGIGTAVGAVERVDGALAEITEGVGEVHNLLGTMAADNQTQSSSVTEISSAIASMDQSTQQNAAMVEETSAAARNLLSEVGSLSERAAMFQTGGGASNVRVTAPASKVRSPAASGGSPAMGYGSPVAALPANGMAHTG